MKAQWTIVLMLLITAGCGSKEIQLHGIVSVDGAPVPEGSIRFVPVDGAGPTAGGMIENGSYEVAVLPGAKRVEIDGYRVVGQEKQNPADPSSPILPVVEAIVPERYNRKSELTVEISDEINPLNYDLTSESQN